MIKMIYCIRRKPEMGKKDFLDYWHTSHAALVKKNAPALRIKRYIQNPILDDPLNEAITTIKGHSAPYDGVAELWWDSIEDLQAAASTSEGGVAQTELFEDEQKFIDFPASCSWLVTEKSIIE